MTWTDPPIPADEVTVATDGIARFSQLDPDWEPNEGDPEVAIVEAAAGPIASAGDVLAYTCRAAHGEIVGERVMKRPRNAAQPSRAVATVTIDDDAGVTIEAGIEIGLALDGESVPFVTENPMVFPATVTALTGVQLVSVDTGSETVGASSPADWGDTRIASVTVTSAAAGGADEEDLEEYLERIGRLAERRVNFAPISPPQYAEFTLEHPQVFRCAYKHRWDPADPDEDSPGNLGLTPLSAAGDGFDDESEVGLELLGWPEFTGPDRLLQLTVHIVPPTEIDVAITLEVEAAPTAGSAEAVETDVEAAVRAALGKATHDYDPDAAGRWRQTAGEITDYDAAVAASRSALCGRVLNATVNGGSTVALTPAGATFVALPNITTVTVTVA